MTFYDVSVPISTLLPTYPGDPGVEIKQWLALDRGDPANVTAIDFGAHTGTHVDAPAHFIPGGAKLAALDLETLIGEVQVIEISDDVLEITDTHIKHQVPRGTERVLFKTRNSAFWNNPEGQFRADYTYISPPAARCLVAGGVRLVGIDYLSVEQFQPPRYETHEELLSAGVIIIEGLDLRAVAAGIYELICLPLKIAGGAGDGAPARVVLRTAN